MALDPQNRQKLLNALLDAFPEVQDLDLLAFNHLTTTGQGVSSDRRPIFVAKGLIEWAERNGEMLALLDGALAQANKNVMLTAVATAIRPLFEQAVPVYVAQDPYDTCLPRHGMPFVNRAALRATLRTMAAPHGTAVLAVQGEPRTGKSYTSHLISYLSTQVQRPGGGALYQIVIIHLADYPAGFDAGDLANQFALQLGLATDTIPPKSDTEQETRWAASVSAWIVGQLVTARQRHNCDQIWLLVDGFQQSTAAPSAIEVLRRLAAAALQRDTLRVILLDFPYALPGIERSVQRDQTRPATKADVESYLSNVLKGIGRTMDAATLQSIADAIWQEAMPEDAGLMQRLDEAICRRLPLLLEKKL